jgi:hypothetical protein
MICSLHAHRKGLLTVSILINAVPVRGPRGPTSRLVGTKTKIQKSFGNRRPNRCVYGDEDQADDLTLGSSGGICVGLPCCWSFLACLLALALSSGKRSR